MQAVEGDVAVDLLLLDPFNPRLPETVQGASQEAILEYLDEHDVLDELIDSYIANGYFINEPVLVLPADAEGRRVVVEGNRRVAAAMRLLSTAVAESVALGVDVAVRDVPEGTLERLERIPAFELQDRDEVASYLGFRHISGLKTWNAEAKARYLWLQVERAASLGHARPFYEVGRQVGSNTAGVRTAYNSFNLIQAAARLVDRADVDYVKRERFAVWTRLLSTANVPKYMGIDLSRGADYVTVRDRADDLIADRAAEVVGDLRPADGSKRAVLQDSRSVTDYSDVLGNERARSVLREYSNLALAMQVVEQGRLNDRIEDITESIEVLTREVPRMDTPDEEVIASTKSLVARARALLAVVKSQAEDDED